MKEKIVVAMHTVRISFILLLLRGGFLPVSYALPEQEHVAAGEAYFDRSKTDTLEITASDKAIINYNSFNINTNQTVRFIQPSSSAAVLNRVTGAHPSEILGSLLANGRVFLINPNGIFFGPHSRVDVGSFLASTLDIADSDFLAGNYEFSLNQGVSPSYIINRGHIKAGSGGFVVLQSPLVSNEGLIAAEVADIVVSGVRHSSLTVDEKGLVSFVVPRIEHDPGVILIPEREFSGLIKTVVNAPPLAEAIQFIQEDGVVKLTGIEGVSINSGEIIACGTPDNNAGTVQIISNQAAVLTSDSVVSANGYGENSPGGRVEILSHGSIEVSGGAKLKAKGGTSGDGGFIEISAPDFNISREVIIDTSADEGRTGIFLLDPNNIIIQDNASAHANMDTDNSPWGTTNDDAIVDTSLLAAALQSSNIVIQTLALGDNSQDGDITVSGSIDINGCSGNALTLQANRHITLDAAVFTDSNTSTTDAVSLTLTADRDNNGTGLVDINTAVNTYGGSFTCAGNNFDNTSGVITTSGGAVTIGNSEAVTVGAAINTIGANGGINFSDPNTLILKADLNTDGGNVSVGGTPDIIIGGNVTVDTESGADSAAGNIYFGSAGGLNVYAAALGYDLTLNTIGGSASSSGDIGIGLIDNNAAGNQYINDLVINAIGGGADPFENCGLVSLKGNVFVDDDGAGNPGSITIGGRVKYMCSVNIDTEQGGNTNGGIVSMPYANTAANAAASYDLSIDTSPAAGNHNGGAITLYKCGHLDGQAEYVDNLSITSSGSGTGNAGTVAITGGIYTTAAQTYTTGSDGTITISGNVEAEDANITFAADTPVSLDSSITIKAGTGTLTINDNLAGGSNDFTLAADEIDLLGGNNSVTGSGSITLGPSAAAVTIGIAGAAGTLDLSAVDLAALSNGFSNIYIGRNDQSGAVRVQTITFNDPVTIRSGGAGGSIIVNSQITGSGDASVTLRANSGLTLNDAIVTANQPIEIITVNSDITINDTASANDINAGASTVSLNAGGENNTLTLAAGSVVRAEGGVTYTADNIVLTGTTNAGGGDAGLAQSTSSRQIDFGSETAGKLSLTCAELDTITAGKIIVGDTSSGTIFLSDNINLANTESLEISSGASIQPAAGKSITESSLTLDARGGTVGLISNPLSVNIGGVLFVGAGGAQDNISANIRGTTADSMVHGLYESAGLVMFNNRIMGGSSTITQKYSQSLAWLNPYITIGMPSFLAERVYVMNKEILQERQLPF